MDTSRPSQITALLVLLPLFILTAQELPPSKIGRMPSELATLHRQFESLKTLRVSNPHQMALRELSKGYRLNVDQALRAEKAAGNLDTTLALTTELKNLDDEKDVPPTDEDNTPFVLKKLRDGYRAEMSKLDAAQAASLLALTTPLKSRLLQLEMDMTRANRIEDAQTIRAYRLSIPASPDAARTGETTTTADEEKGLSERIRDTKWTWGASYEGSVSTLHFSKNKTCRVNEDPEQRWKQTGERSIKFDNGTTLQFSDNLQTFEGHTSQGSIRRGKLIPTVPEFARTDMTDKLSGRYIFQTASFKANRELKPDGSVKGEVTGNWRIDGNKLVVVYSNGAWVEFELPFKDGKANGKTNKNEAMEAVQVGG